MPTSSPVPPQKILTHYPVNVREAERNACHNNSPPPPLVIMSTLKLYGHPVSAPCRSVLGVLYASNIPFELSFVDFFAGEHKQAPYLRVNPAGLIPTLDDDGLVLGEHAAINVYLAEKYGLTGLYPTDAAGRARVNYWLHWIHTNARAITTKLLVPLLESKKTSSAGLAAARESAAFVEARLGEGSPEGFLAGPSVSLADLSVVTEFDLAVAFGLLDFEAYPRVSAWVTRVQNSVSGYKEKVYGPVVSIADSLRASGALVPVDFTA